MTDDGRVDEVRLAWVAAESFGLAWGELDDEARLAWRRMVVVVVVEHRRLVARNEIVAPSAGPMLPD